MKKRSILGALLCSVCLVTANTAPVMADAVKVVTLGADLTDAQKDTMMRYFKTDASQVQILTITNADEKAHLSAYVPEEQIGSRTVSCAYVKPTQSGGIKVRTANLNWVTCNMIASTLSTSGVSNCEVVAACPFEVSGTGALTGIMMAYESASGQKLDETKKAIATEELVVTGNLAEQVGQDDATNIINQAKKQIIENNVQNADEIYNIVVSIAEQNNTTMDAAQLDTIVSLLQEIAQQNYDYNEMKETLDNIESYLSGDLEAADPGDAEEDPDDVVEDPEDSIVSDLDESVLGDDVIASSTEDPTLEETTKPEEENSEEWDLVEQPEQYGENDENAENAENVEADLQPETPEIPDESMEQIPEDDVVENADQMPEEEYVEGTDQMPEEEYVEGTDEIPEAEGDESASLNTDSLSEEAASRFEQAKTFCRGEYEGDTAALQTAMGEDAYAEVILDTELGAKLSQKVQEEYLKVLNDGGISYVADGTEMYMSSELNMMDSAMKRLFGLKTDESTEEDILVDISEEDKQKLYDDTMKFFSALYGESVAVNTDEAALEESADGESYEEEAYEEETYEEETYE